MVPSIIDLMDDGGPIDGICIRGRTDDPLSLEGRQPMDDVIGGCRAWELIANSKLSSWREFAEEPASRLGLPLEIQPRFREIGFGSCRGFSAEEIVWIHPGALKKFPRDPTQFPSEGDEPLAEFQTRVSSTREKWVTAYPGKHILLVRHGGTIRIVLSHLLHMPLPHLFRRTVMNGGITRTQYFCDNAKRCRQLIFHHGRF